MRYFGLLSLAATVGLVTVCVATAQDARPAKVAIVEASNSTVSRSYPATVMPSREIEMSFKVSGQVIDLPIRAATQVKEGDVIAQIDTRDFKNQIAQLVSQKDQAVAQLDALKEGARAEEVAALEAAVQSAEAQVDQTRDALARAEQLLERVSLPAVTLRTLRTCRPVKRLRCFKGSIPCIWVSTFPALT